MKGVALTDFENIRIYAKPRTGNLGKTVFRLFAAICFLFLFSDAKSQDTIMLKPVNIIGKRIDRFANEINTEKADSFIIANSSAKNLTEILSSYTNLNIRSYGYGGMASVSMRNGNSYQTAVLWNGFNLQDPLNGGVNLTLIPGFFIDKIEIHHGGETALFGSGAVGGMIDIGSSPVFNAGFSGEIMLSAGSFGNFQQGVSTGFSGKKFTTDVKVFHKKAENDFSFVNTEKKDNPIEYQKNAQSKLTGIMQRNALLISKKQLLTLNLWYQQSENHIPYSMSQTSDKKSFTDTKNFRTAAGYLYTGNNYKIKLRQAIFYNSLLYNDKNALMEYVHKSFTSISELESEIKIFKKQLLMAGINNTYDKGYSESLTPDARRNRTSVFVSYRHRLNKKVILKLNGRQEFTEGKAVPATFSFKASYRALKFLKLYGSFARNYRLPTFNDLFWSDYASKGNPNLKPENGSGGEIGAVLSSFAGKSKISITVNAFSNNTRNQIHWTPVNGIWTPENLEAVKSKGIEASLQIKTSIGKNKMNFSGSYTFLKSVLTSTDYPYPDDVLGKQLIFTPKHKAIFTMRWISGPYFAEYSQRITGKIYTTSDNSEWLDAYSTARLSAGYNISLGKNIMSISLRAFNLWNSTYYLMPGYPMPGINYEISTTLKLKTDKNEK